MDFDLKELVRQTFREFVSKEVIEAIIRREILEKFDYNVNNAIHNVAMEYVKEKGGGYIIEKIDEIMNGQVRLDDGWGQVRDAGTFEDYVRKSIRSQLGNSWELEKKVRKAVDEKLEKYCKEVHKTELDALTKKVLTRVAEDFEKEESSGIS